MFSLATISILRSLVLPAIVIADDAISLPAAYDLYRQRAVDAGRLTATRELADILTDRDHNFDVLVQVADFIVAQVSTRRT